MLPPDGRAPTREYLGVALLCAVVTAVFAYPLSIAPATTVLPHGSDTGLYLWMIGWDVHALARHPWSIFDANIFHPFRYSLAYSENLIGTALLVAPVVWTTGNLVLALNLSALASVVLCGLGVYVLGRRMGLSTTGALAAALVFAFAPPRFFRIGQPHLNTVQWMPLCLAFLHAYFETNRARDLRWAIGFFGLQTLTSGHGALFTAVAVAVMLAWRFGLGEPLEPARRIRDAGVVGAVLIAAPLLLLLPYRHVQQEAGLRRSLEEASLSSADLPSLLATPNPIDASILTGLTGAQRTEPNALLFPGFVTLALVGVGFLAAFVLSTERRSTTRGDRDVSIWKWASRATEIAFVVSIFGAGLVAFNGPFRFRLGNTTLLSVRSLWRPLILAAVFAAARWALSSRVPLAAASRLGARAEGVVAAGRRLRSSGIAFAAALAVVTFWLALGPAYGLYELLYQLPGGNFVRVPSRFTIVTLMALAIVAGAGLDRLTARLRHNGRWLAAAVVCCALLAEFAAFPLVTSPFAVEIPPADRWLAAQPKPFVVAELPSAEVMQATYMLHSTAHWQKTIHGYSGARPSVLADLYKALDDFPTPDLLDRLQSLGVTHVVVHSGLYPEDRRVSLLREIDRFMDRLTLLHEDGDDRVYVLRAP